jgi:hypothetical protein
MNKTCFAFLFLLTVFGELSAQQSEKLIAGNTNTIALSVDSLQAGSSTPSSSCYVADLIQTRKRVPVDTSQRLANPTNGESQQLKKRVPVDTSLRLANPTSGVPQQLKKRVPVDTSQRVGAFEYGIAVFPNPASGTLYLRQLPEQTTVRLYSSSGLLIREERATGNSLDLDLSALPEGVYILQLTELNQVLRIVHTF